MRDACIAQLTELAILDPRIMLITGDLGFKVLDRYIEQVPRQFLNAGIAEQNMLGVATGLALEGRTVFVYSIANFPSLRCLEQIRNDAAYHGANVKILSIGSGFSYGPLGISHHATEDIAILRALPDITVISPGDDWEVAEATKSIAKSKGVAYLRLDRASENGSTGKNEQFLIGKARRLREGKACTLIATGGILGATLRAADSLAGDGICCRVLSMHTVSPIDVDSIVSAAKETGGIITVEEHSVQGGLGSAVAEVALEQGNAPRFFYRLGLREGFSKQVGSQEYLRRFYKLDTNAIVARVRTLTHCSKKKEVCHG